MHEAYLFLKVAEGYEGDVVQRLKENKNVEEVHPIYGYHNIITKVKAKTKENLPSVINQIKRYNGVDEQEIKIVRLK